MGREGSVENPEWLYFFALSPGVEYYTGGGGSNVNVHDRVPEIAGANSATLRRLALPSNLTGDRYTSTVAVLARPGGRTQSLRIDPDAPANRKALLRWLHGGAERAASDLWYVPGSVLDAFIEPQYVSLPSSGVTRVVLLRTGSEAPSRSSKPITAHRFFERDVPVGARLNVLVVAGSTLAPRIIRPGLVLDAYCVERRGPGGVTVAEDEASVSFHSSYIGRVLSEIPDTITQRPLPGQPVEDLIDVDARAGLGELLHAGAKKAGASPWFVSDPESVDALLQPLFAEHEALTRFRQRQRSELVVVEEIDGDSHLRDEELGS